MSLHSYICSIYLFVLNCAEVEKQVSRRWGHYQISRLFFLHTFLVSRRKRPFPHSCLRNEQWRHRRVFSLSLLPPFLFEPFKFSFRSPSCLGRDPQQIEGVWSRSLASRKSAFEPTESLCCVVCGESNSRLPKVSFFLYPLELCAQFSSPVKKCVVYFSV